MSDKPADTKPAYPKSPPFQSIFGTVVEDPAPDAQRVDEAEDPTAPKVVVDGGQLKASLPLGGVDPFDHKPEQDAIDAKKKEDGVAPPPMPTDDVTQLRNPNMMMSATDRLQDEMERRFQLEVGDMKVQVTGADRDAFVRAAMHDTELIFDIQLDGLQATVQIAMAPDEFTTSASAAVNQWGRDGHIDKDSDLQWLLAFQQMHAWYQVRAINGEPTAWSDFWVDGMPPLSAIRKRMREHDSFEPFFRMSAARWRMLLDAVRTAEFKYKVCLQNWKNRSFFTGAATD